MQESGIYCIENLINHKRYIGQSKHIFQRWYKHKSELNNQTHFNDYLQKSWNKDGENNFDFYVVTFCDENQLDELEIYYISLYDTTNRDKGYNLQFGGQANRSYTKDVCNKIRQSLIGHEVSEETRQKISQHHADVSGSNNPMFGTTRSDDVKMKVSIANKGKQSFRKDLRPIFCVELNMIFDNATMAAQSLNIDSGAILKCCRHEKNRHTCGGYHWEFV